MPRREGDRRGPGRNIVATGSWVSLDHKRRGHEVHIEEDPSARIAHSSLAQGTAARDGFVHDPAVLKRFVPRYNSYKLCDVAMSYPRSE
ncbi:MAG: hypothetical protein ACRBN8_03805 [Nannocystales bacterium]